MSSRTPLLKQLMGAYFHQDFYEVHGSVWGAVDAFVADEPLEAAGLPAEIEWVMREHPTEEAVDDYLDGLGCEYLAQPGDGGYRGWLAAIAARVASQHPN